MARDKGRKSLFDPGRLLTGYGAGQSRLQFPPEHFIYAQGDTAEALFYVERGQVKISVVVPSGKEAVVGIRGEGEFFGEACLAGRRRRIGAAMALTDCSILRITTAAMTRLLHDEPTFADAFIAYEVDQRLSDNESLVDQLTNSAERRLARTLLRLADFGRGNVPGPIPARVNQTMLAEMVGTTRSRINFFMNKFKRQGLIEYYRNGEVRVCGALSHICRTSN
jgi:CRP-like cAMP-binding protein